MSLEELIKKLEGKTITSARMERGWIIIETKDTGIAILWESVKPL